MNKTKKKKEEEEGARRKEKEGKGGRPVRASTAVLGTCIQPLLSSRPRSPQRRSRGRFLTILMGGYSLITHVNKPPGIVEQRGSY